jgi:dihydrofolate reductase
LRIVLVAALGRNRVIGHRGGLPWRLPADLRRFRKLTVGKTVVMGGRTWDSIGAPLPRRVNIVLTRRRDLAAPGCRVVHSVEDALVAAGRSEELVVVGAYEQFLPHVERMYLTLIDADFEGDTFFPEWNPDEWTETERHDYEPDDENPYRYSFVTLDRRPR